MNFHIDCIRCGKGLKCPISAVGKKVSCPKCGEIMISAPLQGTALSNTSADESEPLVLKPRRHSRKKRLDANVVWRIVWALAFVAIVGIAWYIGTQTAWVLQPVSKRQETQPDSSQSQATAKTTQVAEIPK